MRGLFLPKNPSNGLVCPNCKRAAEKRRRRGAGRHSRDHECRPVGNVPQWGTFLLVIVIGQGIAGFVAAAPFVPKRDAHSVAFSPDGKLAVIGYSGQSNQEFPPGPHPNPRKCGVVQWFDVTSGRRLQRKETFGDITRVAFSADGRRVAAARLYTTLDGIALNEVRVWQVATGNTELVFDRCQAFTFLPSGGEILVVSRKQCVVYRLADGSKVETFPALAGALSVDSSPDGTRLVAVMAQEGQCMIRLVSRDQPDRPRDSPGFSTPFYAAVFSPSGDQVASGHAQGHVLLWDATTLNPIGRLRTGGQGLQHPFYSPDGQLLAAGDQRNSDVVIWDRDTGEELRRYTFKQGTIHAYHARRGALPIAPERSPQRFAFSHDGSTFLAGPYGGIIRLVSTGQDLQRFGD